MIKNKISNKIFVVLLLGIFLMGFASAAMNFNEEDGNYGSYEIDSIFPSFLGGNGESYVKLIENTDICLVDCEATIEFTNELPVNLLEDISFLNRNNEDVSSTLKELSFSIGKLEEVSSTTNIYKRVCEIIPSNSTNSTNTSYESCFNKIIGEKETILEEIIWEEYSGEEVSGLSYLKINAKKNPQSSVDWIITFRGKDLDDWAWWDSDWDYKKEYTNLTGNISYMDIEKTVNDENDFKDTRFTSCYDNNLVFNHTLESLFGGTGLPYDSGTSPYDSGMISYYKMDESSGTLIDSLGTNNLLASGTPTYGNTGIINAAIGINSNDDYFSGSCTGLDFGTTDDFTINVWYKGTAGADINIFGTALVQPWYRLYTQGTILYYEIASGGSADRVYFSGGDIYDDSWHMITMKRSNSGLTHELFVDGILSGSDTGTTKDASCTNFYVGDPRADRYLDSLEDEFGIWNRALTEIEIETLYNATAGQFRVNNQGENCTERYYGNSEATSTSNASEVYYNPISAYYFDSGSQDYVGNNAGTIIGATLTTGYINNSYSFDGTNDYITLDTTTNIATGTNERSVSTWINPSSINQGLIFSQGKGTNGVNDEWGFGIWNSTDLYVEYAGSTEKCSSGETFSPSNWYHAVMIYNGTTTNFYVNGIECSTPEFSSGALASVVKIGTRHSSITDGFDGKIDEVLIYDKVLTSTQIESLYNQTAPVFIEGDEQEKSILSIQNALPVNDSMHSEEFINFSAELVPNSLIIKNATFSLWEAVNETFYEDTTDYDTNETVYYSKVLNLSSGNYTWDLESCESSGNCALLGNRTLYVDINLPTINISSPIGVIPFLYENYNLTLSYEIADIGSGLDECWYVYDSTNISLDCAKTEAYFNYTIDENFIEVYAKDNFGGTTLVNQTFQYEIFEIGFTFDNQTIESSINDYSYHFKTPFNVEQSFFNYGSGIYSPNTFDNGTNQYRLDSTIEVPAVLVDTNYTFNFSIQTENDGIINSTNKTQLILILEEDDCSVYTTEIITGYLFDERTLADINGTVELNLNFLNPSDNSEVSSFKNTYENLHEFKVCTNLNTSDKTFLYDLELRYFKSDGSSFTYAPEFYHIQKAEISTFPQNISLYDLNSNESTEFTINYRDNNYIAGQNHLIQVLRTYVGEGISRVVEIPITSTEGSAVAHFDLNNYKYNFIVTKDGEIVNVFNNPAIRCESEISGLCSIDLKGEKETPFAQSVSELSDFEYVPSIVEDTIKITFSSPSGTNKNVRALMVQSSPFTDDQVICNASVTSASGTISCEPNETIGDSSIAIKLYVDGEVEANLQTTFQEDLTPAFQGDNYFIGALLLLILVGMAVSSPQLMVWMGVFGLVLLGFLFLLKANSVALIGGAVIWFVLAAVIVTMKINNRSES